MARDRRPALSLLARRLRSQLLSGPSAKSVGPVVERLLAVQAQDPRAARLSIRSRTAASTAADVAALLNDGSLVVDWLCRGTLHLVRREDHAWLHAMTTPSLHTASARRLAEEGVTPAGAERGLGVVANALAADGPLTRGQLRDRLDAAGVRTAGQALVHILFRASLDGVIVRGPMAGGEQAFVLRRDWLGPAEPVDPDRALAELARRYLAGHGPAAPPDLARWAKITLGQARAGLRAIGSELVEREDGLVELSASETESEPELPGPRLLGPFEPVLLGWTSREDIIGPHTGLVTTNGIFRAFAMVGGRAVATWKLSSGSLTIEPLERIARADRAALDADGVDVLRFLGLG